MWKRDDGSDPIDAVQNRFTAYLAQAISHQKGQYIRKKEQKDSVESRIDSNENSKETDFCENAVPRLQAALPQGVPVF